MTVRLRGGHGFSTVCRCPVCCWGYISPWQHGRPHRHKVSGASSRRMGWMGAHFHPWCAVDCVIRYLALLSLLSQVRMALSVGVWQSVWYKGKLGRSWEESRSASGA